jgi:hypothetical protein
MYQDVQLAGSIKCCLETNLEKYYIWGRRRSYEIVHFRSRNEIKVGVTWAMRNFRDGDSRH